MVLYLHGTWHGAVIDVILPKWYFLKLDRRILQDLRVSTVSIVTVPHRANYLLTRQIESVPSYKNTMVG
jgi:hypothetical protein